MEDEDDNAEMAPDYGTDFSDDVDPIQVRHPNFHAKARPQHSGIGNRIQGNGEPEAEVTVPPHSSSLVIPRFPGFSKLPGNGQGIPVSRFGRETLAGQPRFPIRPGTGNRGPDSAGRGFPGLPE